MCGGDASSGCEATVEVNPRTWRPGLLRLPSGTFARVEALRFRCNQTDRHLNLRVVEQRHKTKIHVQLLVTVEQREAGVVGNEIDLNFLIAT